MKVPVLWLHAAFWHCHHLSNGLSLPKTREIASTTVQFGPETACPLYSKRKRFMTPLSFYILCQHILRVHYTASSTQEQSRNMLPSTQTSTRKRKGDFFNILDSIALFQVAPLRHSPIHVQVETLCLRRPELASDSASYCSCRRERYIRGRRGCSMVSQVFE